MEFTRDNCTFVLTVDNNMTFGCRWESCVFKETRRSTPSQCQYVSTSAWDFLYFKQMANLLVQDFVFQVKDVCKCVFETLSQQLHVCSLAMQCKPINICALEYFHAVRKRFHFYIFVNQSCVSDEIWRFVSVHKSVVIPSFFLKRGENTFTFKQKQGIARP